MGSDPFIRSPRPVVFRVRERPKFVDLFSRGVSIAGIPGREDLTAKRSRPEMAPQRFEKIESAPGIGMASEGSKLQYLVHGRWLTERSGSSI
jgi:hypothetical protein